MLVNNFLIRVPFLKTIVKQHTNAIHKLNKLTIYPEIICALCMRFNRKFRL